MDEDLKPTAEQRDSLHILPLCMIPIRTPALRRASLIKNNRLETAVELFRGEGSGSGQIYIRELMDYFSDIDEETLGPDVTAIRRIDKMTSFDVYSCRISLRSLGIEINDQEYLKLSEERQAQLSERMRDFTRPLILQVFGADLAGKDAGTDLIGLLRNPDRGEAMRRLNLLADELQVPYTEIPRFIEDYGDIFLSLAYFRDCLDHVVPVLDEFLEWLDEVRGLWMVKNDRPKEKIIRQIEADFSDISGSITGRFESFDRKTKDFWSNVSANQFREVRDYITSHHTTVGGVLCGLTLKMDSWRGRFSKLSPGSPQARLEYIIGEILPGLDQIKRLEEKAARSGSAG